MHLSQEVIDMSKHIEEYLNRSLNDCSLLFSQTLMQQYVELLSLEDITSIYYRNESQIIRSIRDHLKKYRGSFRIHNVILLSKQLRFVITNLYIPSTEKLEPELINISVDVKPKITDLATVICELSERQMIMDKEARYRDREIAQLKQQQKHEVEMATTEEKKEDDCYQLIPKKAAFNPRKSLKQQLMEMGWLDYQNK